MFWKYNSQSTSQIDALLEKADVGLTEVLEQEDIIQECKNQNRKLVDYLVNPDVLSELIGLIITEPSKEIEESARFRLPHIAAEILSCEVPQINEQVSSDENMLKKLYSFLEQEPPLNPLLSSFFSKAFGVLITRKSEQNWYNYQRTCIQVFEFLKKKNFVDDILRHIGTSAIPDLVLRLITCVEGTDIKQTLLDWLNEKRLVQSTISLLDSKAYGRDVHDNASRLLIELLRVSRDGQFLPASERCDDPLLAVLESPSTVHLLLDQMFMHIKCSSSKSESDKSNSSGEENSVNSSVSSKEDNMQSSSNEDDAGGGDDSAFPDESCESVLVNGISVLLAILETRKAVNNSYNTNDYLDTCSTGLGGGSGEGMGGMLTSDEMLKHQGQLNQTVSAMIPRLNDITKLLTNPPLKPELKTTSGTLCPPFGSTRLSVVKLISALLSTNIHEINLQFRNLSNNEAIIGVNAWKRNWKKNMKSLFVIKVLLFLNHWFSSAWMEFKYSIGKLFLRGIVPDSYWNSIPRNNSLKKRRHQLIKSPNYLKNRGRNQYSGPIQKHYPNRRQFENVKISLTSEIIFSVFLLIILFVAGFILGYNFSENQTSLFFGQAGTTAYPSSALSNTDTKTITTYSNSSVTNTNNDKDTITNTVSSG